MLRSISIASLAILITAAIACTPGVQETAKPASQATVQTTTDSTAPDPRDLIDDEVNALLQQSATTLERYNTVSTSCFFASDQNRMLKLMELGTKSDINEIELLEAGERYMALDLYAPVSDYEEARDDVVEAMSNRQDLYDKLLDMCR